MDTLFFQGKRVLVTGHTGFKGTWLCCLLSFLGADVVGYSLRPNTNPSLYELSKTETSMKSYYRDIRDYDALLDVFRKEKPELVIHMAAQPIVRESYKEPRYTYETNVMGTVNLLECVRLTDSVRSVVNVTTDKVYLNRDGGKGYQETEPLNGYDPYSNSKSCSDIVTQSYRKCFLEGRGVAVSTARAGNVIGGGDFAVDRIIPDCMRAALAGNEIIVRNPNSTRPYQHVLEPLVVYLDILARQVDNLQLADCYNVGPDDEDCLTTGELVDLFCKKWGEGMQWVDKSNPDAPHEAGFLKLDCTKLKTVFGWKPNWKIDRCMDEVCRFGKVLKNGGNIVGEMEREIRLFLEEV